MNKKFLIIFFALFLFFICNFRDIKSNSKGRFLLSKKPTDVKSINSIDVINIYSFDLNGEKQDKLTSGEGSDYDATWSPDGKMIAFVSNRDTISNSKWDIYTVNENGSNLKRIEGQKIVPQNQNLFSLSQLQALINWRLKKNNLF